jgi:predicted transcriptional regulator
MAMTIPEIWHEVRKKRTGVRLDIIGPALRKLASKGLVEKVKIRMKRPGRNEYCSETRWKVKDA